MRTIFTLTCLLVFAVTTSVAAEPTVRALAGDSAPLNEPVELALEGLDPDTKYRVTIVRADRPVGDYHRWADIKGQTTAEVKVEARQAGPNEIRLHSYASGNPLILRRPLTITAAARAGDDSAVAACPGTYKADDPEPLVCRCPAAPQGNVWGTEFYSGGSSPCVAAVHAGVISAATGGTVTLRPEPGQESYRASTRRGVRSQSYGAWPYSFVVLTADGDAPPETAPEVLTASQAEQLAKYEGAWEHANYDWGFEFSDGVFTVTQGGDRHRPIGTEILQITEVDGPNITGLYVFSNGLGGPVTGTFDDAQLDLSGNGFHWTWERVQPAQVAAAPAEDATADAGTPDASTDMPASDPAPAASPEEIRERFPLPFEFIGGLDASDAVTEGRVEVTEMVFAFLMGLHGNEAAQALGISAESFANLFSNNPAFATGLIEGMAGMAKGVAEGAVIGMAEEAVAENAGNIVAGYMFHKGPLSELPSRWQAPLKALVAATIKESVGLLLTGTNPSPTALAGPIVARLNDIREIHEATTALEEIQQGGLVMVAIGAEINTNLVVDYPNDKSGEMRDQWWETIRGSLPGIVGRDDIAEVNEVVDLGYQALEAQRRGDDSKAADLIRLMNEAGERGEDPLYLPAENPVDLLVRIAAGGDAPRKAAQTFVSATRLGDLVREGLVQEALQVLPSGPWGGDPDVRAAIADVIQQHPGKPHDECANLHGPLGPDLRRRLLENTILTVDSRRGRPKRGVSEPMLSGDRFCLDTPTHCATRSSQLYYCSTGEFLFASKSSHVHIGGVQVTDVEVVPPLAPNVKTVGMPIYHASSPSIPVGGRDCTISSDWSAASSVTWTGDCTDGRATGQGTLDWKAGDATIWRTHVRDSQDLVLEDGVLRHDLTLSDFSFSLTACNPAHGGTRRVAVTAAKGRNTSYFLNTWMVAEIGKLARSYAEKACPSQGEAFRRDSFTMALASDPDRIIVEGSDFDPATRTWQSVENSSVKAMRHALEQEERARREAERQRAAKARERALAQEYRTKRGHINERVEAFLDTGEGNLQQLAAALELNQIATLGRLEEGVSLRLSKASGVETTQHEGKRHYRTSYTALSPYARLEHEFRKKRDFSWENWMKATQTGAPQRTMLICLYRDVGQVPQEARVVRGELASFSTVGSRSVVSLLCR